MPKFESPIKVSAIQSLTGNTTLLHIGADNRVGIGTTAPETKLHVDGTITATGLIVKASSLATAGDAAEVLGFTPNMDDWYIDANGKNVVNGWIQTSDGVGTATESTDRQLGLASAEFDNADVIWQREISFDSPLYANVFIQGSIDYKFDSWSSGSGTPGLAITVTHRQATNSQYATITNGVPDWNSSISNTFITPVSVDSRLSHGLGKWTSGAFRAHTPGNREITKLKFEIISSSDILYDTGINDGGSGNATSLGGGVEYNWNLDALNFNFMHPDMRIDQNGRIIGAYIQAATIEDLHIKNMISSTTSLVYDRPAGGVDPETSEPLVTLIPEGHERYPDDGLATGEVVQGLVANDVYGSGWSISKTGKIKATDLEIYGKSGNVLISGDGQIDGRDNPFAQWADRRFSDFDPEASAYLYGLAFEESNKSSLMANLHFLATSGLDSNAFSADDHSIHFANVVTGFSGASGGGNLSNGFITYNGITSNAPPGSIYTSTDATVIRNQDAYILFLANTQKWDTNIGAQQEYHANTLLGEYGLYVLGTPTVGGWLYHPHGNNTWYTIDSNQSGNRLHENDFLVIGRIGTDVEGKIRPDKTYLQPPKHPDSITSTDSISTASPIGITAGGVLFADIHLNQWAHTANAGEIQFTNQRNNPNTRFTFIHPGTDDPSDSTLYTVNGASGVLTSLEDFPGSRYITFIGAAKDRVMPGGGTGFNFDYEDHSPDFVAAFPIGERWFYNQDEGKFSEFTPESRDCIVARVDANGSVGALTNIYRYAEREATTSEGGPLSDMIIDPPRGMASGGLVLSDLTINREFQKSDNTFIANSGFVAFTNPENNPRNEFYVIHPDNGNNWLIDSVGRGVATSLNPTNDVYGTRHIAFVGGDNRSLAGYVPRFPAIASHYNVANDFIAVAKYNSQGNPRVDGQWYYDPGTGISPSHLFTPIANDFIIATINSYDPTPGEDGIDQINRWAAKEGSLVIDGVETSITSIRNLLEGRIDAANTVAQTALSEAQSAYANAVTAQANVAQALGLLDGAITIYFEEEDASRYYANALSSVDFDYNDLWINISTDNEAIDGSWLANAVFRYSNSLGGFADTGGTEAGTNHTTKLAWRHDPTNPAGLSYLIGLTARGFADRSTTMYYRDHIGTPPNLFGPNVAVMSLSSSDVGELNFNPEGDLWYDTKSASVGEAPANHPYVYRTNATFSVSTPSRSGYITTGTGAWAQTVHNVGTSGTWNRLTAQTGWWSLQDSSAGDAAAGIAGVQSAIDNEIAAREEAINRALINAETAQIAADREILAFFADSTDSPPTSSGNGDIWIHTDNAVDTNGTVNAGSVFVANTLDTGYPDGGSLNPPTRHWNQSPNNAIGLMYLQSYSAGVSGEFQRGSNIMPRGYSLWDAPATDYSISTSTSPAGSPNNTPYPIWNPATAINASVNTSFGYIGTSSLSIKFNTTAPVSYAILADGLPVISGSVFRPATWEDNGGRGVITIPKGKRWIFSYYAYSNSSVLPHPQSFGAIVWPRNLEKPYANISYIQGAITSFTETHKWQRFSGVLDFTTHVELDDSSMPIFGQPYGFRGRPGTGYAHPDVDAGTQVAETLYADEVDSLIFSLGNNVRSPNRNSQDWSGNTVFYDGFQLEEVPTTVFTPSQFKEPSQQSSIVFGREITDGKIVAHFGPNYGDAGQWYGPIPNITPGGLPNPEPHGDRWINTSNNNIEFVYNQSGVDVTTQTAFWTTSTIHGSGWYTAEDPRTTNALSTSFDALANAETAQAAADREIIAFFDGDSTESGAPLEIDSDSANPTATGNGDIWIKTDSFATLNTSSIYTWRSDLDRWRQSPTSAIGQVYLNSFLAERKASRAESLAISITGSADLPFPVYPDANGIFVGATGNLAFYRNSQFENLTDQSGPDNTGSVFVANRGNIDLVGPNGKIWYSYSSGFGIPDGGSVYSGYKGPTGSTTDSNTSFSSLYLMYSNMNAATRFGLGGTPFGTHNHIVPVRWNNVDGQSRWEVEAPGGEPYDFIPDAANGDFLVAKITRPTAVPEGFSTLDSWVFKTLPVQIQAIGDGKIVTHFAPQSPVLTGTHGPRANLTPTGLANPEPHGDFWINTSNNNLIFRYHQNVDNNWAQTAFHAPTKPEDAADQSGWYSTEDLRTANAIDTSYSALSDAATAQRTADHELLAFFEPSTNSDMISVFSGSATGPATGNGDIWIQTDYTLNPNGSSNTKSILVANLHPGIGWVSSPSDAIGRAFLESYAGVGVKNWMPAPYSTFNSPGGSADYSLATGGSSVTSTPLSASLGINNNGSGNPFHTLPAENLIQFNGSNFPYVHVGLKVINIPNANTNWVGEFHWGVLEESNLSHDRVAYLGSTGTTTNPDSTYWENAGNSVDTVVDLTWDLSGFTSWADTNITGPLYFSFWNSSSRVETIRYEISYISISDTP